MLAPVKPITAASLPSRLSDSLPSGSSSPNAPEYAAKRSRAHSSRCFLRIGSLACAIVAILSKRARGREGRVVARKPPFSAYAVWPDGPVVQRLASRLSDLPNAHAVTSAPLRLVQGVVGGAEQLVAGARVPWKGRDAEGSRDHAERRSLEVELLLGDRHADF